MVGAYFNGHPNDPNVREADILLIDGEAGSTNMLPEVWHRNDEWYNYKAIQEDLTILLNLDETSYEGGTNGDNHPIAWQHEFDGGRAWYTGLGHTKASFSEALFLEHLLGGINYAAGPAEVLDFSNANIAPEENRFIKVVLEDNLQEPMELVMLPDGKLLFIERKGAVRLFDPAVDSSSLIQEIAVSTNLKTAYWASLLIRISQLITGFISSTLILINLNRISLVLRWRPIIDRSIWPPRRYYWRCLPKEKNVVIRRVALNLGPTVYFIFH